VALRASNPDVNIGLPPVTLVDMRDELKAGNRNIFSRALVTALTETMMRREQALRLPNRRGTHTSGFWRDCGYVAACPNCDSPMTYHQFDQLLHCHMCGHRQPPPTVCPNCESTRIKFFGAGTQQVEDELRRLFPHARIVRWDADTAHHHGI